MPYLDATRDAVRGALQMERQLDLVANNLANVNTTGFKADRQVFNELMEKKTVTDHAQGAFNHTGNPLDLAIQGNGFFQVQTPNGVRLTRNGAFSMLADGSLVTGDGYKVLGDGAPVVLNPQAGQVSVDASGGISQNNQQVGRLSLVKVNDTNTLSKEGSNLFTSKDGKPLQTQPADGATVQQGYLETANVQVVDAMVQMIYSYRSFEAYQKILHTMQDMDTKAANQVGRLS